MENSNKVGVWVVEREIERRGSPLASHREFLTKRIRCEAFRRERGARVVDFPRTHEIMGRQSRGTRTLFTQIIPELATPPSRPLIVNPFASVILRFLLSLGLGDLPPSPSQSIDLVAAQRDQSPSFLNPDTFDSTIDQCIFLHAF